ncbi:MAG: hypothetical protein H0X69_08635 [Gemmatimonadales bacterium]|nr:hypothetical protein [Gemmatimonadales bacterium]
MNDDQLDEWLRDAARSYNAPPETPRDRMWVGIRAARRKRPRVAGPWNRWAVWPIAAAAVLAVGIGIGRLSVAPEATMWEGAATNTTAYRLASQEHLSQSEAFLTLFRMSVRQTPDQRLASASARQLLATNRLLLDSPAAAEPATRLLLEDLELVLAEIAQLSPGSRDEDLQLIREGLDRGDMMPRLRTAVPAGPAPTQGVL